MYLVGRPPAAREVCDMESTLGFNLPSGWMKCERFENFFAHESGTGVSKLCDECHDELEEEQEGFDEDNEEDEE